MNSLNTTHSIAGARVRISWPLVSLYLLLGAGGLWHLLGLFQTTMALVAGPLLIGLSIVVVLVARTAVGSARRFAFDAWSGGVLLGGFLVEWAGVNSGLIFGVYSYGSVLQPQLLDVPVSIGFAWTLTLLSSLALAQRLLPGHAGHGWAIVPVTGALMVLFDALMEPAATVLNYWSWPEGLPLRNYLAWFVFGSGFAAIGHALKLTRVRLPGFVLHAWFAQALYFAFVILGFSLQ